MKPMLVRLAALAALALAAPAPAFAQIQAVDPDTGAVWQPDDTGAAENSVEPWSPSDAPEPEPEYAPAPQNEWTPITAPAEANTPVATEAPVDGHTAASQTTAASETVAREDIFTAATGVFGDGAEGLAGIIEDILKDQGEPVAYIAGEEASGAFIIGARWGSGVMRHRVDGDRTVYWRGPSVGFDVGADASKVFILVYNLRDSQDIFRRYVGGEGRAYFVGGFTATYLRRGDTVLIPIRLGVGVRLGVNANYLRFSERNRWLPF